MGERENYDLQHIDAGREHPDPEYWFFDSLEVEPTDGGRKAYSGQLEEKSAKPVDQDSSRRT